MRRKILSMLFTGILLISVFLEVKNMGATDSTSGAYVYDDSNFIYLGNDFLEIKFSKNEKGAIYSFINKLTGQDYRTDKTCYEKAWEMMISTPNNFDVYKRFDSNAYESFSYNWSSTEGGFLLFMAYSGGPCQINIITTVHVSDNSSLTQWRIKASNNEPSWAVEEAWFPLITGFQKLGISTDDYLLISDGMMLHDPYTNIILAQKEGQGGMYPSQGNGVQLMLVGDNLGGLYVSTYDPECYAKIFEISRQGSSLDILVGHLNVLIAGQSYETPYDTIFGIFQGEYWNALCYYRDWGRRQWWAKNGTILERDVPKWFEDGFSLCGVCCYTGDFDITGQLTGLTKSLAFEEVPYVADLRRETLQSPLLLSIGGWERYGSWVGPDCFPPAEGELELRHTITSLHGQGQPVMFGLTAGLWDVWLESYNTTGRLCTICDREGKPKMFSDGYREVACMSLACEAWKNVLIDNVLKLVTLGADAVHLDAWLHQPGDYSGTYQHPLGFGNWYTKGLLNTVAEIKRRARLINPQFLISSEGITEFLLPYIDMYFDSATDIIWKIAGQQYGREISFVPLFSFIYRDYAVPLNGALLAYSDDIQKTTEIRSPLFLDHIMALGLVSGAVPQLSHSDFFDSQFIGMGSEFTFSYSWISNFYGNMLEYMPFDNRMISLGNMSIPSFLSSIWKSSSGDLCYVCVNIGHTPYKAETILDPSFYGLENKGNYSVILVVNDEFQYLFSDNVTLPLSLNFTVDPESVAFLVVCQANESDIIKSRWEAAFSSYRYSSVMSQARSRGIPVEAIDTSFRDARREMQLQNYQNSIICVNDALVNLTNILERFSFVLNDPESFQNLTREAEALSQAGRFFEAATKAFEACGMVLQNMRTLIFFDNLHTDRDYFSSFSYDIFKSHFESTSYEVKMSQAVPMSWSELNGTKAAVFWAPSRGFTTTEINMILEYVEEGNNLIMLLDGWMPGSLNGLTRAFGVEVLAGAVIAKDHYENDEGTFVVNNFTDHPVAENMSISEANWIAPLKTVGSARTIAYTSIDTWTSEDPKIVGPFAYIAWSTYGRGKVLVVADNLFMELSEHLTILDNTIEWFLGDYWQILLVDLNRDRQVNILDITIVATAYGSLVGSQDWNELADLDGNDVVDILDIAAVAMHFGETV